MAGDVLRDVGPTNVDSAGELVARVGVHNQAKRLIDITRRNYPRELVAALSRPADKGRTQFLDADEVEAAVQDTDWKGVEEVESATVRGQGDQAVVGVLFRTEKAGRTARGIIPYSEFTKSRRAYDDAVKGGYIPPVDDESDVGQLRAQIQALRAQGGGTGPNADAASVPEPYPGYADAKVDEVAERVKEAGVSELVLIRQAEEARGKPRQGVLDAVDARLEAAEAALKDDGGGE